MKGLVSHDEKPALYPDGHGKSFHCASPFRQITLDHQEELRESGRLQRILAEIRVEDEGLGDAEGSGKV